MGIAKTLFEDWMREQKLKKHRAQIDAILKENQTIRVTKPQNEYKKIIHSGIEKTMDENDTPMTMEMYEQSGQLDQDIEQLQQERMLNQSVAAIISTSKQEKRLTVECSHDGTNVLISTFEDKYVVGKWRYIPPKEESNARIHLYHMNYHYNEKDGPNYHLQKAAGELFTAAQVAEYILRHDRKKAENDKKDRQTVGSAADDLIGE